MDYIIIILLYLIYLLELFRRENFFYLLPYHQIIITCYLITLIIFNF